MKSLKAYSRIDLDMGAHAQGTLQDRLLQGARGAPIDVVLAERAFGGGDLGDRLRKRSLPGLAAVENAGLVEMNMRLDEAGDDELAGNVLLGSIRIDAGRNLHKAAAGDGDVRRFRLASADAGVAQNQIESHA